MNTTCWWQVKWNVQRTTIKSADKKVDTFSQTNNNYCYASKLVSKQLKCPGYVSQRQNIRVGVDQLKSVRGGTTQMWDAPTQDHVGSIDFGVNWPVFTPCVRQI